MTTAITRSGERVDTGATGVPPQRCVLDAALARQPPLPCLWSREAAAVTVHSLAVGTLDMRSREDGGLCVCSVPCAGVVAAESRESIRTASSDINLDMSIIRLNVVACDILCCY